MILAGTFFSVALPTLFLPVVFLPVWAAIATAAAVSGVYGAYRRSRLGRARSAAARSVRRVAAAERKQRRVRDRYRRRVQRAAEPYRSSELGQRWRRVPTEALRDHGASAVRFAVLDEAKIVTVGDLSERSDAELQALKGLGPKGVESLRAATNELRTSLASQPLRPPSSDLEQPGARRLAVELLRLLRFRSGMGDAHARLATSADRLEASLVQVKKKTGLGAWFKSLWKRDDRVDTAVQEAEELEQAADEVATSGLLEEVAEKRGAAQRDARRRLRRADVEEAYRAQQASVASLLDEVVTERDSTREAGRRRTASGGSDLAPELLTAIESTALHSEVMSIGLRRYQQFGTRFLLASGRTVLGDEMGLGKTVQALAAMAQLYAERGAGHFIVVAPAGILLNWQHEIEAKSFLKARLAHGASKDRVVDEWLRFGGVLIVSYATLRTFDVATRIQAAGQPVDLLVADEAHYVKNPEAQRTVAVGELLESAGRVCLMTGTPMENHPREFARLIDLLGREDWRKAQSNLEEQLEDPESGAVSERFRSVVSGIYLRRNQDDVLQELPEKIVVDEWVELSGPQRREYHDAVQAGNFMGMRQAVTLPVGASESSKLGRVAELLDEHREEGRRVIVFSFFLRVLEELAERFDSVGTIHGGVAQQRRAEMIEEFGSSDGGVLLAQITAAGHGLNLQMASVVILMEPQLTPGAEAQAIARAHRMGQTQRVLVHRLVTSGTVDERLVEILARKQELFDEYARPSVAKESNPEAVETQIVSTIIHLEQERLRDEVSS